MRLRRNDICNCGSGLKYKKCCMNRNLSKTNENSVGISLKSVLSTIRFGLENLKTLKGSERNVRVKEIDITNVDTIQCKFYSYSENSIDIKGEIGTIMGFFSGFLKEESFDKFDFKYYSVRAYNKEDNELLWALSPKEAANSIGKGNSIGWLKSTIFQENTDDYRLGVAKKKISEIENSLRHVVKDILSKRFGDIWWDKALGNKLGKSVKEIYLNQFGEETSDGNMLIDYTYVLQLKKIITTNWPDFKHLFNKKQDFENSIDKLNKIRREEAHNRVITEVHLIELDKIYTEILSIISQSYIDIIPTFLIDNWKLKVKNIMNERFTPNYSGIEIIDEVNQELKLIKVLESTNNLIDYLESIIQKLKSVVTPIQKKVLHDELIENFCVLKVLQERKINYVTNGKLDEVQNTIKAIEKHESKMNNFTKKFIFIEA